MPDEGPTRRADRLTTVWAFPLAVSDRLATMLAGLVSHGVRPS